MNLITQIRESLPKFNPERSGRWTQIVERSEYSAPKTGDAAMFDLYALYALYWQEGSGREHYGYEPVTFLHSRKTRIDRTFEEALFTNARRLLDASRKAVAEELENLFDPYLIDPMLVIPWVKENIWCAKPFQEISTLTEEDFGLDFAEAWWARFDYHKTIMVYQAPFWKNEKSDMYGGEKWAVITDAVMDLDSKIRRGSLTELMSSLDRLYDLEHNTGSLSGKFERSMRVSKQALDIRAGVMDVTGFLPFVSPQVAKLIRRTQVDPAQQA